MAKGERVILVTDERFAHFTTGALSQVEKQIIRAGTVGGSLYNKVLGVGSLLIGIVQARRLLKRLKPKVVIGFGGYPSFPTVFAATGLKIPAIIHEQNSVLGRANRLLAPRVNYIATSFPYTLMLDDTEKPKIRLTGNPVRQSICSLRGVPYPNLTQDGHIRILVTGGSQGASIFSTVVPAAVAALPQALRARVRIDQQCREADLEATRAAYAQLGMHADLASFFVDLPARLAGSHLVIARSGASTVCELAVAGRPGILVPLPTSMDNHQYYNAQALEDAGGGWVMPQEGFTAASLAARLEAFLTSPATLTRASEHAARLGSPDAAAKLAELVLIVSGGQPVPQEYSLSDFIRGVAA